MAYLLQQLLVQSASGTPGKEAVRCEGKALSYAELDDATNRLARLLRENGVRRGDRVGIYLNKSLGSVLSVFGIMKAGGVYVPLDPNAPAKRLAFITRNCGVRVLLSSAAKQKELAQLLAEETPLDRLVLTDERELQDFPLPDGVALSTWREVAALSCSPVPLPGANDRDLAYILYTSGSTGDPKGVMIAHRTIMTFVDWCRDTFRLGPEDRITSHAPLHFDLSTFDIYATIKGGGTVVLIPETLSVFPQRLAELLQNERITVSYLVPSILSLMVNYGNLGGHDLSSLRAILFAGEVFPTKYLRKLMAAVPHAGFFNLYGPTETNVCTYYQVQAKDVAEGEVQPVPIGIACANTEVFAVDDAGELVDGAGQEGELWVRGSCVAQGYWGDQQKTARSFVVNPFQTGYAEVTYRTGDIVKLDPDEVNWRLVGRRDHMIKSRGYRIELGEIEVALYSHGAIKEAVAVAIPDELVGNRIKAYVVPLDGEPISPRELQDHCATRLPRYMVPEAIELRPFLPKNSSGKIDRPLLAKG